VNKSTFLRLNHLEIENVLLKTGFVLNNYPEGDFWELTFSINQDLKGVVYV